MVPNMPCKTEQVVGKLVPEVGRLMPWRREDVTQGPGRSQAAAIIHVVMVDHKPRPRMNMQGLAEGIPKDFFESEIA